jgi:hypothetical protein
MKFYKKMAPGIDREPIGNVSSTWNREAAFLILEPDSFR